MRTLTFLLPLLLAPALAEEPLSRKEALSEALYTEEVLRDSEAAAAQYTRILETYRAQRAHAATALFRLAEIRRGQGREDDAIGFYQEYLANFADLDPQADLARKQLAALGAEETPDASTSLTEAEAKELARLKGLLVTAPDVVVAPNILNEAAANNHLRVIDFLLGQGSDPWRSDALNRAVSAGYLEAAKKLIEHNPQVPERIAFYAAWNAHRQHRRILLSYLLDQGFPAEPPDDRSPSLLMAACGGNDRPIVDDLLARGSAIDWRCGPHAALNLVSGSSSPTLLVSALHTAIYNHHIDLAVHLLGKGASPTLAGIIGGAADVSPLHLAARSSAPRAPELIRLLVSKGADPSASTKRADLKGKGMIAGGFRLRGETPLEIAVYAGLARNAEALIKAGATPDSTFLLKAVENLPLFEALLAGGADPNKMIKVSGRSDLTIFQRLCYDTDTTPEHVDLMMAHGATLDPDWIINGVRPHNNEFKLRKHLLTQFSKNERFNYRSSVAIQVLVSSVADKPSITTSRTPSAEVGARKLAGADPQVFVRMITGTDLFRFDCYDSTPAVAKARADKILLQLRRWEDETVRDELIKNGQASPTAEQISQAKEKGERRWLLHEEPKLPTEKVSWK